MPASILQTSQRSPRSQRGGSHRQCSPLGTADLALRLRRRHGQCCGSPAAQARAWRRREAGGCELAGSGSTWRVFSERLTSSRAMPGRGVRTRLGLEVTPPVLVGDEAALRQHSYGPRKTPRCRCLGRGGKPRGRIRRERRVLRSRAVFECRRGGAAPAGWCRYCPGGLTAVDSEPGMWVQWDWGEGPRSWRSPTSWCALDIRGRVGWCAGGIPKLREDRPNRGIHASGSRSMPPGDT